MSAPPRPSPARRRRPGRAIEIWLIALLVALVATVQIRSQAEVERSLVGTDTTTLAFLIDDLHRANDALSAETADLALRKAALQSGGSPAADQELTAEANRLAAAADLITQQMRGDRRVRLASYRVEADIEISAVVTARPFVYANPS